MEELQKGSALVIGFPISGKKLATKREFLCLATIAEVQQYCVQQSGVHVNGLPCYVEISGKFLVGGETFVEIDFSAS